MAEPSGERRPEQLELRLPTSPTHQPAVRAMAADLALRMDFDLDSVEDLRLAVDEACATLAAIALPDARLTVVFEASRSGLRIDAWVPTAPGTDVPTDGFGWAVLEALVDSVESGPGTQAAAPGGDGSDSPVACIVLVKRQSGFALSALVEEIGAEEIGAAEIGAEDIGVDGIGADDVPVAR